MEENGGPLRPPISGPRPMTYVEYRQSDARPYRVMVEAKRGENGVQNQISRSTLSWDLKKVGIIKTVLNTITVNKWKVVVLMDNYMAANDLCKNPILKEKYNAYIPSFLVSVSGVVSGISTEIPLDDIKQDINTPNVEVTDVQRLKRRLNGDLVDAWRIKVTFRTNKLPEQVRIFNSIFNVRPFYRKPSFCENCLRYNHTATYCRGNRRCSSCTDYQCQGCNNLKCLHCRGQQHKTNGPECREVQTQKQINKIMATSSMLYIEARKTATSTSNMFDALAQFDDPTPAESMNVKDVRPNYAYVLRNTSKNVQNPNQNQTPKQNQAQTQQNRSRKNSANKRQTPSGSIDYINSIALDEEDQSPKKQRVFMANRSQSTNNLLDGTSNNIENNFQKQHYLSQKNKDLAIKAMYHTITDAEVENLPLKEKQEIISILEQGKSTYEDQIKITTSQLMSTRQNAEVNETIYKEIEEKNKAINTIEKNIKKFSVIHRLSTDELNKFSNQERIQILKSLQNLRQEHADELRNMEASNSSTALDKKSVEETTKLIDIADKNIKKVTKSLTEEIDKTGTPMDQ